MFRDASCFDRTGGSNQGLNYPHTKSFDTVDCMTNTEGLIKVLVVRR